jgi:hypothetical protein
MERRIDGPNRVDRSAMERRTDERDRGDCWGGVLMSTIELTIGDARLSIALDTAGAPGLSAAMLRAAPHDTLAVHCATAGAEFCVPVPFFHWHENRRPPGPGDVGYASFGNYLCFYYGPMSAVDGPTNVIGRLLSPAPSSMRSGGRC